MTAAWKSPVKTGARRPIVRATIQRTQVRTWTYDTFNMQGGDADRGVDRHGTGAYTSVIFGNNNPVREIKNIQSCSWERTLDQDVATCTIELLNSEVTHRERRSGDGRLRPAGLLHVQPRVLDCGEAEVGSRGERLEERLRAGRHREDL
jgi:hypothetical protein